MSWLWYPYWYYWPPIDPYYLMPMLLQMMVIPYYYVLYIELIRATIEAWKSAFESIKKAVAPT